MMTPHIQQTHTNENPKSENLNSPHINEPIQIQPAPTFYQLDFSHFHQHLIDVTFTFTAESDQPELWLPSWLPGSYLMREFSRNITTVYYQRDDDENDLRADKISKNEWQLSQAKAGEIISVTYEVYCYDLSVRTAYVDGQRIYGNFSALLLAIAGQEDNTLMVTLKVPDSFYRNKNIENVKLACGLECFHSHEISGQEFTMQADNYDELIDHPFELSEQVEFDFLVENQARQDLFHRFFISGHHHTDTNRLKRDVQRICQSYVNWLGDTPFSNYTFMTFASGNDYGGLEHINSTSLVTPRDDLPTVMEKDEPSEAYQRYLGLCSHEYFHAWWVKTVRPDVMINVDLKKEAYTPLLWVFEGFTSYIDDFMLQASGAISKASYLKLLTGQINRYNQTMGRALQSVAESSFDAWIKLYRPDENTGNAGISYYNKGALVALCLDLTMLKHTDGKYRLFDVVKTFYERAKQQPNLRIGMTNENLSEVICRFIEPDVWQAFYDNHIVGVQKLPFSQLLTENGIRIDIDESDNLQPWGIQVSETGAGLVINKVNRDSVASEAGLSAKDVIVAIDGIKASKKQLMKVAGQMARKSASQRVNMDRNVIKKNSRSHVVCHAFRRDELIEFSVPNITGHGRSALQPIGKVSLSIDTTTGITGITGQIKADSWLDVLG